MDKFELLCLLEAISNYAYDIHYTAKGRYFFSDHLFSERLSDVDVKDDFIETFYLGKSEEAPSSADIARKVAALTPQITDNTQDNFKRLRDLIIRALMLIQKYDGTKGEEDILGAIAHILQRHNGLLYRQLTYTPEEIRNDNSDWRDIVSEEDTTQTLENAVWHEEDHPRKKDGTFTFKGEGESGSEQQEEKSAEREEKTKEKVTKHLEKCKEYEPKITKTLEGITKSADGAKMVGLEFRLKSNESTLRKVKKDAEEKNWSENTVLNNMYDIVRYTQESPEDKLVSNFEKTMDDLKSKGYIIIQIKNTFKPNAEYKGINCKIKSPEGNKFELQFHTPKSLEVKEVIHKKYEKQRQLPEGSEEYKKLGAEMHEISRAIKEPRNIDSIKNYQLYKKKKSVA